MAGRRRGVTKRDRAQVETVLEIPGDGGSPHCGWDPHVIHGVEVSALSAPRCGPPLAPAHQLEGLGSGVSSPSGSGAKLRPRSIFVFLIPQKPPTWGLTADGQNYGEARSMA